MIYHLLPEPFSSVTGLGIAKVVANMMHFDESRVVCSQADDTWGIDAHRIVVIPELSILSKPIGWRFLPSEMIKTLISHICGSVTSRLKNRDIVWCHNGPYTAAALKPTIHLKG